MVVRGNLKHSMHVRTEGRERLSVKAHCNIRLGRGVRKSVSLPPAWLHTQTLSGRGGK